MSGLSKTTTGGRDQPSAAFNRIVEILKTHGVNPNNKKLILHLHGIIEPEFLERFRACFSERYIFSELCGGNPEYLPDYHEYFFGLRVSCNYNG